MSLVYGVGYCLDARAPGLDKPGSVHLRNFHTLKTKGPTPKLGPFVDRGERRSLHEHELTLVFSVAVHGLNLATFGLLVVDEL